MGSYFLLQRIFPTKGLNTGLGHCRKILYHLSPLGSPYDLTIHGSVQELPSILFYYQCLTHWSWWITWKYLLESIQVLVSHFNYATKVLAAAAKSLQACPTLCDPIDSSPPGFPVPGILQGRTLEWAAISFSNAWKWKVKVKLLSRVWLCATPRTAAYQAPPSMGFSRQEYWSGVPLPSPTKVLTTIILFQFLETCLSKPQTYSTLLKKNWVSLKNSVSLLPCSVICM